MRLARSVVVFQGKSSLFRTAVVAGATILTVSCHAGIDTPSGPSINTYAPATSAAVVTSEAATLQAAPLLFDMPEVGGSGYSGTCTVGTGGGGFSIKTAGQGRPDTTVRFVLSRDAGGRHTDFVDVNNNGVFRTNPDRITYFLSGDSVACLLLDSSDDTVVLAESATFQIP